MKYVPFRLKRGRGDDNIVGQLEMLNDKLAKQNSTRHIFYKGIIYGVGFFIGSAVIATIALGILGPWVGKIEWIADYYELGASIKNNP